MVADVPWEVLTTFKTSCVDDKAWFGLRWLTCVPDVSVGVGTVVRGSLSRGVGAATVVGWVVFCSVDGTLATPACGGDVVPSPRFFLCFSFLRLCLLRAMARLDNVEQVTE